MLFGALSCFEGRRCRTSPECRARHCQDGVLRSALLGDADSWARLSPYKGGLRVSHRDEHEAEHDDEHEDKDEREDGKG
eukprot:2257899-Alexandrium_andersonii.AAC.1